MANVDRYSFRSDERPLVEAVMTGVRVLLRRSDQDPRDLLRLAQFLVALDRLPSVTTGFGMSVGLCHRVEHELNVRAVSLDEESFRLDTVGSVYDPAVGSDTYASVEFEVGQGWRDDAANQRINVIDDWLQSFLSRAPDTSFEISIEEFGDPVDGAFDAPKGVSWDVEPVVDEDGEDA